MDFQDSEEDELTTVDKLGLTPVTSEAPKVLACSERYKKYVIILGPNEFVVGYEPRVGKVLDSISIQTNEQYLGPYGGNGGELKGYIYGDNLQDITLESVVWKDQLVVKKIREPVWQIQVNQLR